VLPADASLRLREVLEVGRRVRVAGTQKLFRKPGALRVAFSAKLINLNQQ
jgi:hypothetical protein